MILGMPSVVAYSRSNATEALGEGVAAFVGDDDCQYAGYCLATTNRKVEAPEMYPDD